VSQKLCSRIIGLPQHTRLVDSCFRALTGSVRLCFLRRVQDVTSGEDRLKRRRRRSNRPGNSQANGPRDGLASGKRRDGLWPGVSADGIILSAQRQMGLSLGFRGLVPEPWRVLRMLGARRISFTFAPPCTRSMWRAAANWFRSPAMKCRCNTPPACCGNISTREARPACSTFRIWASSPCGRNPARSRTRAGAGAAGSAGHRRGRAGAAALRAVHQP